jgi:hypothetical protein
MDVFLIPVGRDRYELYCEVADDDDADDQAAEGGAAPKLSWWQRRVARFREIIKEAEAERDRRAQGEDTGTRGLWRYIVGKIAEAVAEQRLLWRLQRETAIELSFPDDLDNDRALTISRESLRRDYEKHRRWMGIDALIFLLFVPLTLIPGPNVPALYFSFRALGHFFSMRGARRGLDSVTWTPVACHPLCELRQALTLEHTERRKRLEAIARLLKLERLPGFVERLRGAAKAERSSNA